jgi:7-carboxy-7-deazaguanine synthase
MTYRVKEVFLTLQGEGHWTGRAAVFCRFSGCNLWTGREEDREGAICKFCDTDFVDHTEYDGRALVDLIEHTWGWRRRERRMVVLTGGEPSLQADAWLISELADRGFYVAIETNGTRPLPPGIHWVCVSPKTPKLRVFHGDELKLVYPQQRIQPERFIDLRFRHHWLSPMDGPELKENTAAAVDYIKEHPRWRLSVQTHKYVGIP